MTKYILHGGYTRESNEDNAGFYKEWTQGLNSRIKILLCFFAEFKEKYFDEDKERLIAQSEIKDFQLEIARIENFEEQIENSDVIYFRGGSMTNLLGELRKFPNLENLFSGKVIVGSSAGAYALSKYYWNNDKNTLDDGLGILNIKCFCHYKNEDKKDLEKLLEYKENLPIITLPDYKWVTIYQ